MDFTKYTRFRFDLSDRILTVTMNRPDQLNAFDRTMEQEMVQFLYEGAEDPDFDVVVLTGAGRAFCAGGSYELMQQLIDEPDTFSIQLAKRTVFGLLDFPKPVVAKVNGAAVGLGATLALYCDVIFAAEHAKIGDPHVSVGFVAGDGGAIIWPQLIGYARAKEFLMTGELLTAAQAERIGLINHCVKAEELDAAVDAFARRLAGGAVQAISWTKQSINIGLKQIATATMDACIAYEALSNRSRDHQEAVNALREKRKPRFGGR